MQVLSNADMTRLHWGAASGPDLGFGTLHEFGVPIIRTTEEAVNLLTSTAMSWNWGQTLGRTVVSGITRNGAYLISFQCNAEPARALAELRQIEVLEDGLPYKLILPIVATIKARAQENYAPHNYQFFVNDGELSCPEPALSQMEIREEAELLLTEIMNTPHDAREIALGLLPDSAVNRGLVWYAACARLWQPEILRRLSASDPALYIPRNIFLQAMALTHIRTTQPSSMMVAGQQLRVSAEADHTSTWSQLIEFAAGAVPPEALRYLCDQRLPVGLPNLPLARPPAHVSAEQQATFLNGYRDFRFADSPIDADLAAALCRALLDDVAERGESYVPTGGCRVQLPENTVLKVWGITELRVWLLPQGLWCALPAANHLPGVVVEWRPGQSLRRWAVSDAVAPALEVVLTALWRDLRVEGDTIVPARNRRPPQPQPERQPSQQPTIRNLPRKSYFSLGGDRDWGEPEERERIRRAAHAVAGHKRRLRPGAQASTTALQRAAEYAFIVPQGYTFVRPHIGGLQGQEPAEAELKGPIVRARGLATVAAWLRA